jgi:hypothetical protein
VGGGDGGSVKFVWGFLFLLAVGYFAGYQGRSDAELAGLARRAGFPESSLPKLTEVVHCESSGRPRAVGDTTLQDQKWGPSIGPFQVRSLWAHLLEFGKDVDGAPNRNPLMLWLSPEFGAQTAYDISGGGKSWAAWTCG